jgi:hypothetical protein
VARTLRIALVTALLTLASAGVAYGTYCWVDGKPIPVTCTGSAAKQYNHGCSPIAVAWADCTIGKKTATLRGVVLPNNLVTRYHFEYRKASGGAWTSSPEGTAGPGWMPVTVSAGVSGLTANTKYYFRLVAVNAQGSYTSSTQSFTTLR